MFCRPKIRVEDFEATAMPYLADLYRSASLLLRNRPETEDLVQEVFLEAWKSFHRLYHLRRWIKASKVDAFASPADQDKAAAQSPAPQEIQDDDILLALEKVPVEFREVVLMADVEEFSYREIADTLKIPLGTVMSRLSRARKLLRRELANIARGYGIRSAGTRQGESG